MQKNNKRTKIIIIILLLLLTTGCTKTLTDSDKKAVKNPTTGQTLTANIICQPTNKETIEIYKENKVNIDKLPKCSEFKINSGKYEGLWTSIFVKTLAYFLLLLGGIVKNYGVSVIIISLIIRFIAYPITKKTAMQSEIMKKAQPEINRIQKKYANKKDQESMIKQNQETMAVYKKYNINPMSGCLFAMIQLPIFIAFFEAVQRTPVIFEDRFLGLQLGTTPSVGITNATFYSYIILMLLIAATTYFSFKMSGMSNNDDPTMKMMPTMMTLMIIVTAMFMPTGLGIYWITSNVFTIAQNYMVRRSREVNGKKKI
ncbi:MAG: YidC/Oxa1 family membrane protein insertase [Bacilli bacterium]|nr:YidC/Oxa1 family membrane protein insertase [Bacilli bacterium]